MLLIVLKNLILVACIYCAYKLSRKFFDDNQKLLRIVIAFILTVIFFGLANGILNLITPSVNVEKQLQNDETFVALKRKYPKEYQSIVEKVNLEAKSNKLNEDQIVEFADQQLAPLAFKLVSSASDDSRYEFTKSYAKSISLLKSKGGTLCYDVMYNQGVVISSQKAIVEDVYNVSGMRQAILAIVNDNKVGKAVASKRDMDKMEEKIFRQLVRKHSQDIKLLANPKNAVSVDSKKKVCQMVIDLYESMNDPNSKVKMALLRRNMQNISEDMKNLGLNINEEKTAIPAQSSSPQMAAPAF